MPDMSKKQKYYVVWKGVRPGIYGSWADCRPQIEGYEGALYKSFDTAGEAGAAYRSAPYNYIGASKKEKAALPDNPPYEKESLAVDAACSGNPGDLEYRGVFVETGQEAFRIGPYRQGTNNIGEFLAIVHGLALLKKTGCEMTVYSDSRNAILWVSQKKCRTKLERTSASEPLFQLIGRAEKWLGNNAYRNKVLKWDTSRWGEIPADFGRK
jgi:ribonuclease HI